jgi:hypothetical protein
VDWKNIAKCKGMDINMFFPVATRSSIERELKSLCYSCDVQESCLEDALTTLENGGDLRFQYIGWRAGYSDRVLKTMVRIRRKEERAKVA